MLGMKNLLIRSSLTKADAEAIHCRKKSPFFPIPSVFIDYSRRIGSTAAC
jgi:hypothetical protein